MDYFFQYPDVNAPEPHLLQAGSITDVARAAERFGWYGMSFTEHPAPGARWLASGGHQTLDPFVALTAAAAVTERLRLLPFLSVIPYRNPLMLAKTVASVDIVSNGRMILGAGVGYLKGEYFALGVDFEERNELVDEALDVLPLHWSGEPFSYSGKHFNAREIQARPAPVQQPIPIWLGGNAKLTLRRVAEKCQGWMPMQAGEMFANTARTPAITTADALHDRMQMLRDLAGDRFAELAIVMSYIDDDLHTARPDVERHRDALGRLADQGATHILVSCPSAPFPAAAEFLESFASNYF